MNVDLDLIKMVIYSDVGLICSPDTVKKLAEIVGNELKLQLNREIEVTILPNNFEDDGAIVGFTTPSETVD